MIDEEYSVLKIIQMVGGALRCKKLNDYMPQESGSIQRAGLKAIMTFH